jgi:hypothetical protein
MIKETNDIFFIDKDIEKNTILIVVSASLEK